MQKKMVAFIEKQGAAATNDDHVKSEHEAFKGCVDLGAWSPELCLTVSEQRDLLSVQGGEKNHQDTGHMMHKNDPLQAKAYKLSSLLNNMWWAGFGTRTLVCVTEWRERERERSQMACDCAFICRRFPRLFIFAQCVKRKITCTCWSTTSGWRSLSQFYSIFLTCFSLGWNLDRSLRRTLGITVLYVLPMAP